MSQFKHNVLPYFHHVFIKINKRALISRSLVFFRVDGKFFEVNDDASLESVTFENPVEQRKIFDLLQAIGDV